MAGRFNACPSLTSSGTTKLLAPRPRIHRRNNRLQSICADELPPVFRGNL
jgi:hypothetical protein